MNGERPSEITSDLGVFDRFAERANIVASRAPFFAFCLLLVVVWLPSYFAFGDINTWQLIINTVTTIVTFLLVAMLQDSQTRSDQAMQRKRNAIAEVLAGIADSCGPSQSSNLKHDVEELRAAVGLEQRESA